VLTALQLAGFPAGVCLAGGIAVSVVTNFLLNRRFTFSYARDRRIWPQFAGFIAASAVGMVVNYAVASALIAGPLGAHPYGLQLSAVAGIAGGMVFNYLGNRYVVFRKRYIRDRG
jgi:dolichol-phosphate mannosyltransferase